MTISRNQPLTTDDMARLAPSALAREASDGISQRDICIPTLEVINGIRQELRACNADPMSTQANRIIPRERPASIREAPVNQKHAARFLNMHPKTVLRKAREGSLPAHPVGTDRKRWHFYLSELDQWLRSQVISGSHPRRQPQGDYIG
jgi:excisionase family DNA binding protein